MKTEITEIADVRAPRRAAPWELVCWLMPLAVLPWRASLPPWAFMWLMAGTPHWFYRFGYHGLTVLFTVLVAIYGYVALIQGGAH